MPKKILIIDDEIDVMKMIEYRLKARGYEVLTSSSGQEGIVLANEQGPDLILLDFKLLDMEASQISANIKNRNTPIVLITASVEGIEKKAQGCSASQYITKPIDPDILYDTITALIG